MSPSTKGLHKIPMEKSSIVFSRRQVPATNFLPHNHLSLGLSDHYLQVFVTTYLQFLVTIVSRSL